MNRGIFTISLDFELHWGGFEKWPIRVSGSKFRVEGGQSTVNGQQQLASGNAPDYTNYFLNTRKVIPEMLRLFERYEVHVTWAGVGMLMNKDKGTLLENFPALKPTYQHDELSAYSFIEKAGIGQGEEDDPFHYGDSLVRQIISTEHQELGSHTFSHFYCNEPGQTVDQFRADLQAAQRTVAAYGKKLKSLVFPRNQFNDYYLCACFEEGFTAVRSNPQDWFWHIDSTQHESAWKRLNRGLDAYLPVGKKNTYTLSSLIVREGFPIAIPASRLLRPYKPLELFLNQFKLQRIKFEMRQAARDGEVYHLWWHPHNFGWYPNESLEALEEILKIYSDCANRYNMVSMNMGEVTNAVCSLHGKSKAA